MSALRVVEAVEPSCDDLFVAEVEAMLTRLGASVADDTPVEDAARIDRIAVLERLRAATAAAQAAECVRFARSQVDAQLAAEVHPRQIGRGIADQIGLACRISPTAGSRRLAAARAWWFDLPATYAALTAGQLSEPVAELVATETAHLDPVARGHVDTELCGGDALVGLGVQAAAARIRAAAYRADPHAYIERGRTERKHRRVTLRPAPNTMALLTGYLPVEQGVACWAALRRHTDTIVAAGDGRSRDKIMADTLVERLTGQTAAGDVPVEVQLVMPLDVLLDPNSTAMPVVTGHGPIPAELAREWLAGSAGAQWWRRLFTAPAGPLVGGDPTRRRFDGVLATLIIARDQTCRDPYCDAPIRHLDHITRHTDGGPTTLANGRGVCARGNYVREMPGWSITLTDTGLDQRPHTVIVTTPTGHHYLSRAPDPP